MPISGFLDGFQSLLPLPTSKLGPSGADSWVDRFLNILGQDPVGLSNKLSCEARSFSCHCNPHRFLRLYFPMLESWVVWSVSLPRCSSSFIHMQIWDYLVCQPPPCHMSSPPQLPISAPPTSLNECFFINSLVVGLPYSLIFWQFCLFFVFKFVILLLDVRGGKV